jgi:hypothetical protein
MVINNRIGNTLVNCNSNNGQLISLMSHQEEIKLFLDNKLHEVKNLCFIIKIFVVLEENLN